MEQIYVNKVLNFSAVPEGMAVQKKGGLTISVKKRRGVARVFSNCPATCWLDCIAQY